MDTEKKQTINWDEFQEFMKNTSDGSAVPHPVSRKKPTVARNLSPNLGNEYGSCSNSFDGGRSGELGLSNDVSKMMILDGFTEIRAF